MMTATVGRVALAVRHCRRRPSSLPKTLRSKLLGKACYHSLLRQALPLDSPLQKWVPGQQSMAEHENGIWVGVRRKLPGTLFYKQLVSLQPVRNHLRKQKSPCGADPAM